MNDINKISINGTIYRISDLSFEVPILSSAPTTSTLTYDSGNKTFVVNQMCKVAESNGLYTYYRLHSISGESPNETAVWSKEGSLDESDLTGFANKVASATSGNLAGLDSNGNLTDSGVASSNVVTLVDGKVPSSVLPSYVDDVIELLNVTNTAPSTCAKDDLYYNTSSKKIYTATATDTWDSTGVDPKKGKIYVNLADEKIYRWSGNAMVEISAGSAGGSGYDFHGTINITLQSIVNNTQTSATDLNGATVTVTDAEDSTITYSKTWAGEVLVFDGLTPLRSYTITTSNVTGYTTPTITSVTNIGMGVTVERVASYEASAYTITINTNQEDNSAISSATVSMEFGSVTASYTGAQSNQTILVPTNVTPATSDITASSVTNYTASKTIDGNNILVQYQAEKVVVTLTNDSESTDDGGVVYCQNQTVTINGNTVTATETSTNVWQAIAYVAFGTEYSIVYDNAGTWKGNNDYTAPASITNRTASQATYSVTGQYLMQRGTLYTITVTDNQNGNSGAASGCTLTFNYTDPNSVAHTETISYPTTTSFLVPNGSTNISLTGADKSITDGVFVADVSLSVTTYTVTYKATKLTVTRTNGGGSINITANSTTYSISQSSSSSSKTVYVKWGDSYTVTANVDTDLEAYPLSSSGNMSGTANTDTASASITYSTYTLVTSGYADLGLPSGTKWAATNVGASSYTSSGTEYTWVNALGQESGNHKLPSYNDAKEFLSNCIEVTTKIGVRSGYLYISKNNGKAIFNPESYTWTCLLNYSYSDRANLMRWIYGDVYYYTKLTTSVYARLVEKPTGIKAYYSDGTFSDTGTSSAIGVYVCTSNACFMIPKSDISSNSGKSTWDSQYSTNAVISGVYATDSSTTAKTDYAGLVNQEYLYNTSSGCEAAKACYDATVTGYTGTTYRGYLGSCGEWNEAYANNSSIDSMMTAIGGTAISTGDYYWTSTLRSGGSSHAWRLYWANGDVSGNGKSSSRYVRPFYRV